MLSILGLSGNISKESKGGESITIDLDIVNSSQVQIADAGGDANVGEKEDERKENAAFSNLGGSKNIKLGMDRFGIDRFERAMRSPFPQKIFGKEKRPQKPGERVKHLWNFSILCIQQNVIINTYAYIYSCALYGFNLQCSRGYQSFYRRD